MSMRYSEEDLAAAVSLVRQRKAPLSRAASEYNIPVATLHDHVTGKRKKKYKGPERILTEDEENALVTFIKYMCQQGFPMNRAVIKCYAREILHRSGRKTTVNMQSGPSNKWFNKLMKRHPDLSERTPENQDRARIRMSNQAVIDSWFEFWQKTLTDHGLHDKPSQIYNCDETGWSGKEAARGKVVALKGGHVFSQKVMTSDHITAHLCICADGRFLPSMIIFQGSLPHRDYKDGMPDTWAYARSPSGYMDRELFADWFCKVFVPNCGRERPVLLVMDNHDSHISVPVIEKAQAEDIVLVGLPSHTTHLLQPLDVKVIGPLKARFSSIAANLALCNSNLIISKAKFPVVLRHAIEQATPASVRHAFEATGLCPYNPQAIDRSQLIPPTFPAQTSGVDVENAPVQTCAECGSFLTNPLLRQGLVPPSLAHILIPPPVKPVAAKKRRVLTEGRIISGSEMLLQLKDREEADKQKQERQIERKEERKRKAEEKEKEKEKRMKRKATPKAPVARSFRLADIKYTCPTCGVRGRVDDESRGIMWYGCDEDQCGRWYHKTCLAAQECDFLNESLEDGGSWYCKLCKPWLYGEE